MSQVLKTEQFSSLAKQANTAIFLYGGYGLFAITVVVITTAQLHSTKPDLRFWADSNPARGVWEIGNGEDLWQCSGLEIRLNVFRQSTIPQKQFIINLSKSLISDYLTLRGLQFWLLHVGDLLECGLPIMAGNKAGNKV